MRRAVWKSENEVKIEQSVTNKVREAKIAAPYESAEEQRKVRLYKLLISNTDIDMTHKKMKT